jgi:DNA-binding MarR family transcriptional regulator
MIVHVVRSIPREIATDVAAGPAPAAAQEPTVAAQREEILGVLRVAFGELRCVGSERLARQGVSMTNLHVLSILDHHGELTMSHLADFLGVSMSNATGLIDRMEERGFVERARDREDRRVVLVRLTEGGRQQLNDVQILREELIQKILSRLDSDQLGCVRSALTSLRTAALDVSADPEVAAHWHSHPQFPRH